MVDVEVATPDIDLGAGRLHCQDAEPFESDQVVPHEHLTHAETRSQLSTGGSTFSEGEQGSDLDPVAEHIDRPVKGLWEIDGARAF